MQDQPLNPPGTEDVEEMIEGRPWWKVCLIIVVIFIAVVIGVSIIFIRFYSGSGPKRISEIPENFPTELVLYRPELIREMYYYPASSKNKPFELALVPLKLLGNLSEQASALPGLVERGSSFIRNTDTISIIWTDVDATPDEVLRFHAGAFKQAGIADPQMRQTEGGDVSEMIGSNERLNVNLMVIDRPETDVVDSISLFVEYPVPAE